METLVSGLGEDFCQTFVGKDFWENHAFQWRAPADITGSADARQIVWLYHLPWIMPDASEHEMRYRLERWLKESRDILNLRRQFGENLLLVNVGRVSPGDLRARLAPDAPAVAMPAPPLPGSHNALLAQLFNWIAPEYWEVFEALEGTSWLPDGEPFFRSTTPLNREQLFSLLETLSKLPRLNHEIAQLRKTVDDSANVNRELQQGRHELEEESELMLLQLHQVQEELELYYLKNIDAEKKTSTLEKVIAKERGALAQALESNRALQIQLRQIQNELTRRATLDLPPLAPVAPLPKASPLARLAPKSVRRIFGHIKLLRAQKEQLETIRNSPWFDKPWYLSTYPDIRANKIDAAEHYFTTGWKENRSPSAHFDTAYYLQSNPDIVQSGLNPLWHFIKFGHVEGRFPRQP